MARWYLVISGMFSVVLASAVTDTGVDPVKVNKPSVNLMFEALELTVLRTTLIPLSGPQFSVAFPGSVASEEGTKTFSVTSPNTTPNCAIPSYH